MNNPCLQCPKCYSIEMPNAIFCSQCGTKFFQPHHAAPSKSVLSTNSKLFLGAGIIGFIFLVIFSLAVGVKNNSQQQLPLPLAASASLIPAELATEISASTAAATQTIVGKVVGVSDGDTITVLDSTNKQFKIRLEGIDAPESKQDFGEKAKQNLSSFVYGKTVTVLSNKTDKYGRTVGKILIDGKDINLEQIKSGYAWHYKAYASEQTPADQKLYSDAELKAKESKLNLWSIANPTPPWDFRRGADVAPADAKKIFGNKNSQIYHWAGCPGFAKIGENNRVVFASPEEAEAAGYRAAKNCSTPKPAAKAEEEIDTELEAETETLEAKLPPPQNEIILSNLPPAPLTRQAEPRAAEPITRVYERPSTPTVESATSSSASARCADGTLSYSASRRGTCSHHGGVDVWLSGASADTEETEESPSYGSPASSDSGAPKTVNVRGYYRKDGTYVRPHTRSAPSRRKN